MSNAAAKAKELQTYWELESKDLLNYDNKGAEIRRLWDTFTVIEMTSSDTNDLNGGTGIPMAYNSEHTKCITFMLNDISFRFKMSTWLSHTWFEGMACGGYRSSGGISNTVIEFDSSTATIPVIFSYFQRTSTAKLTGDIWRVIQKYYSSNEKGAFFDKRADEHLDMIAAYMLVNVDEVHRMLNLIELFLKVALNMVKKEAVESMKYLL